MGCGLVCLAQWVVVLFVWRDECVLVCLAKWAMVQLLAQLVGDSVLFGAVGYGSVLLT